MKKDDMRIIATVMGEPDSNTRNSEVSEMLDYAFAQYSLKRVLSKDKTVKKVNLTKSKQEQATLIPIRDVNILYKKGSTEPTPTFDIKVNKLSASIKSGDIVGSLKVKDGDKLIDTVELTVKNDIQKANIIELFTRYVKDIIIGNIQI